MTNIIISGTSIKELKTVSNTLLLLDPFMKLVRLPSKVKKFTVIRSPHVTNRSREQFQICTYKWLLRSKMPVQLIERFIETSNIHHENPGVLINCKNKQTNKKNYTPIE